MNKLLLPPAPNWYENSIIACSPDNTLVYGSIVNLVVVKPKPLNEPADVRIIPQAHKERITAVAVNQKWGEPHKLAVSVAEDKVVRLWNIDQCVAENVHHGHTVSSYLSLVWGLLVSIVSITQFSRSVAGKVSGNNIKEHIKMYKWLYCYSTYSPLTPIQFYILLNKF